MKKIILVITTIFLALPLTAVKPVNAKTKYTSLPTSIRSHVWYRLTDGHQGGFHDRTTFTKKSVHAKASWTKHKTYTWSFSKIRKDSKHKGTYYANLKFSKHDSSPVKIKVISSKQFWIIKKHPLFTSGNYQGNANYGAMVYKR
ncbi:hypothetical protein [Pediococcus argentinicus]|uniref:Uncharacterized protein n=1 Tax=Pediococcus argentinicus TaxID=480391 RepID=A0A0R2NHD9_9LACO|nr:hypothetical protein [Pediococcus argentinicus]KRO25206.1 hypothetical protein IV88_GL000333 [Pediococcus argentinicus]NKZ22398.1 hypothetical protein [Pediococcus argentinicus]GEP19464.1 hypothetical protein LSA03_08480 [Pediococcus argentinicus]